MGVLDGVRDLHLRKFLDGVLENRFLMGFRKGSHQGKTKKKASTTKTSFGNLPHPRNLNAFDDGWHRRDPLSDVVRSILEFEMLREKKEKAPAAEHPFEHHPSSSSLKKKNEKFGYENLGQDLAIGASQWLSPPFSVLSPTLGRRLPPSRTIWSRSGTFCAG